MKESNQHERLMVRKEKSRIKWICLAQRLLFSTFWTDRSAFDERAIGAFRCCHPQATLSWLGGWVLSQQKDVEHNQSSFLLF